MADVRVRYFAAAAEAAGCDEETLDAATVGDLVTLLEQRHGDPMTRVIARGSFLVDGMATRDPARALRETVDVLPPFSGG